MVKDSLKSVQINLKLSGRFVYERFASDSMFVTDGPGRRVFKFESDIFQKPSKFGFLFLAKFI